jgi:hypothetical protein
VPCSCQLCVWVTSAPACACGRAAGGGARTRGMGCEGLCVLTNALFVRRLLVPRPTHTPTPHHSPVRPCGRASVGPYVRPCYAAAPSARSPAPPPKQVADLLTSIRSINKTDAAVLLSTFGTLAGVMRATPEELSLLPGLGEKKVRRLYDHFHTPLAAAAAGAPPADTDAATAPAGTGVPSTADAGAGAVGLAGPSHGHGGVAPAASAGGGSGAGGGGGSGAGGGGGQEGRARARGEAAGAGRHAPAPKPPALPPLTTPASGVHGGVGARGAHDRVGTAVGPVLPSASTTAGTGRKSSVAGGGAVAPANGGSAGGGNAAPAATKYVAPCHTCGSGAYTSTQTRAHTQVHATTRALTHTFLGTPLSIRRLFLARALLTVPRTPPHPPPPPPLPTPCPRRVQACSPSKWSRRLCPTRPQRRAAQSGRRCCAPGTQPARGRGRRCCPGHRRKSGCGPAQARCPRGRTAAEAGPRHR